MSTHPFHQWLEDQVNGICDADVVLDILRAFDKRDLGFTERVQELYQDDAENVDNGGDRQHDLWCERQDELFRRAEGG